MTLGAEAEERAFREWLDVWWRGQFPLSLADTDTIEVDPEEQLRAAFAAGVRYGLELQDDNAPPERVD